MLSTPLNDTTATAKLTNAKGMKIIVQVDKEWDTVEVVPYAANVVEVFGATFVFVVCVMVGQ